MFEQTTLPGIPSAISLQDSVAGDMRSDSQAGPTTGQSGQAAPRANRSAGRAKERALLIGGIYGPIFMDSSMQSARLSSWESRLMRRLGMAGSTERALIWRQAATPAGLPLSRLAVSMRLTNETGCGLWPTARAEGAKPGSPERAVNHRGRLEDCVMWPTPAARDWKDGSYCPNVPVNGLLGRAVWGTPNVMDYLPSRNLSERKKKGGCSNLKDQVSGTTQNGSNAETANGGALNPAFVCWLMGYPPEWLNCAPSAMPSSRRSRQK